MQQIDCFVTSAPNLETLLAKELVELGAKNTKLTKLGVTATGDLEFAYRTLIWSRLAHHIYWPLLTCNAEDALALYEGARQIPWYEYFSLKETFSVTATGHSTYLRNSHFAALKVKDAIADHFMARFHARPMVDIKHPKIVINLHLNAQTATISLDLAGDSLHRRGYRTTPGEAPLKETLAAALLCRSGWKERINHPQPIIDPLCGSGTLLIEAALMAYDIAPGLLRRNFSCQSLKLFDATLWQHLIKEAEERRTSGLKRSGFFFGGADHNPTVLARATQQLTTIVPKNAFKLVQIQLQKLTIAKLLTSGCNPGLVITNPPYGKRLSNGPELSVIYSTLGKFLREECLGWQAALFTGSPTLGKKLCMRPQKQYHFFNGSLPCKLLLFDVTKNNFWKELTQLSADS